MFDKLQVALSQGLDGGPHGHEPPHYPVFSKPIFNFGGMGAGSRVLHSREDYLAPSHAGTYVDAAVRGRARLDRCGRGRGQRVWMRHATGEATREGMFDYWTVHAEPMAAARSSTARAWIATHLAGLHAAF